MPVHTVLCYDLLTFLIVKPNKLLVVLIVNVYICILLKSNVLISIRSLCQVMGKKIYPVS